MWNRFGHVDRSLASLSTSNYYYDSHGPRVNNDTERKNVSMCEITTQIAWSQADEFSVL